MSIHFIRERKSKFRNIGKFKTEYSEIINLRVLCCLYRIVYTFCDKGVSALHQVCLDRFARHAAQDTGIKGLPDFPIWICGFYRIIHCSCVCFFVLSKRPWAQGCAGAFRTLGCAYYHERLRPRFKRSQAKLGKTFR